MPARLAACFLLLVAPTVFAQDAAVKDALTKFKAERADAVTAGAPEADLAAADQAAARAEDALKAGDATTAVRLARDARWQVPARPPGLPPHVRRVLGYARLRHADRVNGLAYSPDGTRLASASRDGTVRVWDLGNGRELLAYRGHAGVPTAVDENTPDNAAAALRLADVAWSPDGKTIASCGGTEIHLWDAATGKPSKTFNKHTAPVKCLAFRPDGKALASGGDDKAVYVWDVAKGESTFAAATQAGRVEDVGFSPNGKLVAAVNSDGQLVAWNPDGKAANKVVLSTQVSDANGKAAQSLAFLGDGTRLLTGGDDGTPRETAGPAADGSAAPAAGVNLRKLTGHAGAVYAVGATADAGLYVTAGADRTVRVWDGKTGKPVRVFQGHLEAVTCLAVRPDGRQVATAGEDGSVRLWELSATDVNAVVAGPTDHVWAVAFAPDGGSFAVGGADRTVRVYTGPTGKPLHTLTGHAGAVTAIAYLGPDTLATAGGDKLVKVWDAKAGSLTRDLAGHAAAVLCLAAADGGKVLVSGSFDRTVKGWDVPAGKAAWTWAGRSAVTAVAARPDGKRVLVGTADGGLTVLDTSAAEPKVLADGAGHLSGVSAAAVAPDGGSFATAGGDGLVKLWRLADDGTPLPVARFESRLKAGPATAAGTPVTAVAFSPDGRSLASGGADAVARVWDVASGGEARGLRGHTDWVTAVAFSPDGRRLLSGAADKTARLFELSRQDTAPPPGHALPAKCVAVSRDGRFAASGGADRAVKVWDLAAGKEVVTLTGADRPLNAVGFLAADRLVSGEGDAAVSVGPLRWWQTAPPKEVRAVKAVKAFGLAVSTDGRRVAVWGRDPGNQDTFALFTAAGDPAGEPLIDRQRKVTSASFAADLSLAVTGDEAGTVRVWDLAARERVGSDWPLFAKQVLDVGITPDKKTVLAVDVSGQVKIGDLAKREVLKAVPAHAGGVNGLVVAPAGGRFATLGEDGEVKAWDMAGELVRAWKLPTPAAAAAFTPDGKGLVTANADGSLYVLELP